MRMRIFSRLMKRFRFSKRRVSKDTIAVGVFITTVMVFILLPVFSGVTTLAGMKLGNKNVHVNRRTVEPAEKRNAESKRSQIAYNGQFDPHQFYDLASNDFARVDPAAFNETLSLESWPKYQGYNNRLANLEENPTDMYLLERIKYAESRHKPPFIRLVRPNVTVDKPHEWMFEKIIHQTWIDEKIPSIAGKWVKKWLQIHPDWTHIFWTDKSSREFVKTHYPLLLPSYDSWTVPVQRADMFRYIVLYAMGGVYADIDIEPLRSLETLRDMASCILSREPDVQTFVMSNFMNVWANNWTFTCNAFMACRSQHPFLHYLISRTAQNSPAVTTHECPLDRVILCTGPWMMSFAYTFYRRSISEELRVANPSINVICPEHGLFLPTFDPSRTELVKLKCEESLNHTDHEEWTKALKICETLRNTNYTNVPFNYSFTTHHWFHSYHNNFTDQHISIHTVSKVLLWDEKTQHEFAVCQSKQCYIT